MPRKSAISVFLAIILAVFLACVLWRSIVVAVGSLAGVLADRIGLRRLGGKLAHFDHLGAGKPRQHFLHARIGFGSARVFVLGMFVLRAQRRLSGFVGHDHG